MSNTSHFRHQATDTKNRCIDRVYIKVIDRRIGDQMDKMTMKRPLESCCTESLHDHDQLDSRGKNQVVSNQGSNTRWYTSGT